MGSANPDAVRFIEKPDRVGASTGWNRSARSRWVRQEKG
jgi:hypothetical protein